MQYTDLEDLRMAAIRHDAPTTYKSLTHLDSGARAEDGAVDVTMATVAVKVILTGFSAAKAAIYAIRRITTLESKAKEKGQLKRDYGCFGWLSIA